MKRIEQWLRDRMGMDFNTVGPAVLERTVRQRMRLRGVTSLREYYAVLTDSTAEAEELIELAVVPETWFFRDPEAFRALTQLARTALDITTFGPARGRPARGAAAGNANGEGEVAGRARGTPAPPPRRLRVLSIPCATGEEAYSLTMALLDGGIPATQFQVDAVDLSQRALTTAQRAVYGRNSFRGKDLAFRDRYFERVKDGFALNANVQGCVCFSRGNILDPGLLAGQPPYDFVFCRNLLIYFDGAARTRALERLTALVSATGFLFVGAAELPLVVNYGFESARLPMAFACRKSIPHAAHSHDQAGESSGASISLRAPVRKAASLQKGKNAVEKPAAHPAHAGDPGPAELLETARRLANAGQLREAAELCERHLEVYGVSSEVYYLLGLIEDAQGRAGAAQYYRKALYLDPNHGECLVQMALLCQRQGDTRGARVFQRRAVRVQQRP